jgi:hypothetical protein
VKHQPDISVVLLLLFTACGSTRFTQTGQRYPARERKCQIEVAASAPASGFIEIGTIDVKPGSYGANKFRDLESFTKEIRLDVCEAGGDVAVAMVNTHGEYVRATVLKATVVAPAAAPAAPAAPAVQPAAAPAGCSFDAQCKGDRICVNNVCVPPTAASPAN